MCRRSTAVSWSRSSTTPRRGGRSNRAACRAAAGRSRSHRVPGVDRRRETIIASAVLPVPKPPVSQRPRPASRFASISRTNRSSSRTCVGKRRFMSITSLCSKETARYRAGIRASSELARAWAIRAARQRQSRAVQRRLIEDEAAAVAKVELAAQDQLGVGLEAHRFRLDARSGASLANQRVCARSTQSGLCRRSIPRIAHEPRILGQEGQRHRAERAVAVLGDDQVSFAGTLRVSRVVVVVAVDEDHQVGVLLDGA